MNTKWFRRIVQFAVLALTLPVAAQTPSRINPGLETIRASDLQADLTFLASDALEGRMSLERGSEVAIQFIAAEFAKAGLQPASGNSFLQPVPLVQFLPDQTDSALVLHQQSQDRRYAFFSDFLVSFPRDMQVRAPVVFAGYGITAPEFHYDDYAAADVKGKIVLIFDHEPQENDASSVFNGVGNTRYANSRLKTLNDQKHGAVAVLIASEPNRKHPSNLERLALIPGIMDRITHVPAQALDDSEVTNPSCTISDAVRDAILSTLNKKGSDLQSEIDTTLKPASAPLPGTEVELKVVNAMIRRGASANVVGILQGSDPALSAETIVYSAHYDHDGMRDGQIFHGAEIGRAHV